MKLKILHLSLLFAATTAKDVYVEGATTDSPGAAAVVPAAKLGVNESANYEYDEDAATDSPGAEAVVPAAKLGVNESANYVYFEDAATDSPGAEAVVPAAKLNGVKNEALAANHRRTAECVDTDYGAVDRAPYYDACDDYIGNTHWCGNYDDDDFTSNTMCCVCGGGEDTWARPARRRARTRTLAGQSARMWGAANGPRAPSRVPSMGDSASVPLGTGSAPLCRGSGPTRGTGRTAGRISSTRIWTVALTGVRTLRGRL